MSLTLSNLKFELVTGFLSNETVNKKKESTPDHKPNADSSNQQHK